MATANLVEYTFVINAYGSASSTIWPHFKLRVDGTEIGQATVSSATADRYTFKAKVAPDVAHKLQIIYDNDATGGGDRNLFINSVEVNGKTMLSTAAGVTYDRFALDGKDVIAGQKEMYWDGTLAFDLPASSVPAPVVAVPPPPPAATTMKTTVVINAHGSQAGGVYAHFKLLIDGKVIGDAYTDPNKKDYTFTADVPADQAHKIQIQHDNDGTVNGVNRNLNINAITINGRSVDPASSMVAYDKNALDGQEVIAGQAGMWWDGTLVVSATKDFFPAPVVTTPPAPTMMDATIVVTSRADLAGGQGAHYKLLVDGKVVGDATVSNTSYANQTFKISVAKDAAHDIQIQFDNDSTANGQDRNLYVSGISVNGKTAASTGSNVTLDKYALDGKDVIAGQDGVFWDGTLQFKLAKDYFTGTTTTPPPAPTPPTLSVSDVTVSEPGATTGQAGIAAGPLHTDGNQIVDSAGNNVRLTGINWFGAEGYNYAPNGLWARSYQDMMDQMKGLGFNVIRLPFSDDTFADGVIAGGINTNVNPDLANKTPLQVFDAIIDYAGTIGMKVILDHHRNEGGAGANENGLWYTDRIPESKMIETWQMLAQHYKGNHTVVGADLHNEPHGAATWGDGNMATDWAAAAERIGNAVQTVNSDWLLIVEGTERSSNGSWDWWGGNLRDAKTHDVDFTVDNKLVYSVHSYGPSLYNMSWFKANTYPNNLDDMYNDSWGHELTSDSTPILVGEFGGHLTTDADKKYMAALTQYMNGDFNLDGTRDLAAGDQGVSWTYWSWNPNSGDTGGILNDDWTTVDTNKYNQIKNALYTGTTTVPGQTEASFTVTLSKAAAQAVTVTYATVDGTAKAGSDYQATSGSLTFAAGETSKVVKVKVLGDTATEGTETFGLKLSNPTNAAIADADGIASIVEHLASQSSATTMMASTDMTLQDSATDTSSVFGLTDLDHAA